MKFIFEHPKDILRPQTIPCSESSIIVANLYKKDMEVISSNTILPFTILWPNEIKEEFYLIETKHHPDSTDIKIIGDLKEILKIIKETLLLQNPNITLSETS